MVFQSSKCDCELAVRSNQPSNLPDPSQQAFRSMLVVYLTSASQELEEKMVVYLLHTPNHPWWTTCSAIEGDFWLFAGWWTLQRWSSCRKRTSWISGRWWRCWLCQLRGAELQLGKWYMPRHSQDDRTLNWVPLSFRQGPVSHRNKTHQWHHANFSVGGWLKNV